jgi:acetyl-CoA carboxylase biotin carboxyl carrier protein
MATHDVPSPMTGNVLEVLVEAGASVGEDEELIIIESMKMEIPVESPVAGTIEEVLVEPNQKVAEGDPLLRISDQA